MGMNTTKGPMDSRLVYNKLKRWHTRLPLHWLLAALVAVNGVALLLPGLETAYALHPWSWTNWLNTGVTWTFLDPSNLLAVSRLMIGAALAIMAFGLIFRARIAWGVALLLLACSGLYYLLRSNAHTGLLVYTIVIVALLLLYWRRFDRSSLAAGSLFAILGATSLLIYAVLGTLYLGNEFKPHITDAATAFYFSIVSMSTVGYGDITPQTIPARLFTASIIILGITVFATSISVIAGPIIGGKIQRLVKGKLSKPMRKNHIIIAGVTPLAQNVYQTLHERGHNITVIVPPATSHNYPEDADVIVGDATDAEILKEAGADQALYLLALRSDDSENAFIILASREVCSARTRTVALANTATHLRKIKQVNPDIVFSLQSLGAEILARMVTGQSIDNNLVTSMLFPTKPEEAPQP
jgi:voltage-gated potassium channel